MLEVRDAQLLRNVRRMEIAYSKCIRLIVYSRELVDLHTDLLIHRRDFRCVPYIANK